MGQSAEELKHVQLSSPGKLAANAGNEHRWGPRVQAVEGCMVACHSSCLHGCLQAFLPLHVHACIEMMHPLDA